LKPSATRTMAINTLSSMLMSLLYAVSDMLLQLPQIKHSIQHVKDKRLGCQRVNGPDLPLDGLSDAENHM
jgi:hypothetical protein